MANDDGMFAPLGPGAGRAPKRAAAKDPWRPVIPIPDNAPPAPTRHPRHDEPSGCWTYRNAAGQPLGQVWRFDPPGRRKEFTPLTYCMNAATGTREWRFKAWPAPRPLYRLDRLAQRPAAAVVVCEGEKSAEAAAELLPDHVAVTSPNGAENAHKADWRPLAGRDVTIWPDNDDKGRAYAAAVARELRGIAMSVKLASTPAGAREKWDAAKALAEGWDQARAAALIAAALPVAEDAGGADKPSQRDKLLSIADRGQFWRCDEGIAHCTIPVDGHNEHHRVRSQRFRDWLIFEAGRAYPIEIAGRIRPGTFGKNAVEDALLACEATAAASNTAVAARLRVSERDNLLYLGLGDPEWRAVEIGAGAWRIVDHPPVPILRTRRTRALPVPVAGGSLAPLRELLPVDGEDEWRIVVLWALAALRPTGPYPIIAWSGEQGTGKSFAARVMRRLIDPCGDDIMQPPREDRDLIAAARSNHVLAFDNLSSVSGELADSLCRLATGGDIGGRMLYTDHESAAFAAQRPIILNGIPDLVSRGDLASRTFFVRLSPMRRRRPETELWATFDAVAPGILGALLEVLSVALTNLPGARLPEDSATFRMADFALLAVAAEPALGWPTGAALRALRQNMRGAATMLADLDPVAIALRHLIEGEGSFSGLVSTLHARLNGMVELETRHAPGWPRGAARLGEQLRRLAPALRAVGIDFAERRTGAGMTVTIAARPDDVGNGLSLSESGMGEERGATATGAGDELNRAADLPTLPTRGRENGGSAAVSPAGGDVGSVGTCRQNEGGAYTEKAETPRALGPDRVGNVCKNPLVTLPEPPPDDDAFGERAAILEYDGRYPRAEAERLARAELNAGRRPVN
jgi:putative DNA primase/helicase